MTKMNYKDREKLKFITLPVMIHRDDHDWVRLQLSFIHERYRLKVAFLYSKLFFNYYKNARVTELKRSNYARHRANNFLRAVVSKLLSADSTKNL